MESKQRRRFSREFKVEAVRLAHEEVGRPTPSRLRNVDPEPLHLAIQVRALESEGLGGQAHAPVMLAEDARDVVALEPGPRLAQRTLVPARVRSVEIGRPGGTLTCSTTSGSCMRRAEASWDQAEAVRWYRVVADHGDAYAQYNLGVMYAAGRGVPRDDAVAVQWYRLAADQGDADAQYNLGLMYTDGRGVPQDESEAVGWYRLAADQGDADAQYNLGEMYAGGLGVPQDGAEAARWYRLAADQGDAEAQADLGFRYMNGQGVAQDDVEAHMWFDLADPQSSGEDLDELLEARDTVAERMTSGQIAEAQRRAREWKPTP